MRWHQYHMTSLAVKHATAVPTSSAVAAAPSPRVEAATAADLAQIGHTTSRDTSGHTTS